MNSLPQPPHCRGRGTARRAVRISALIAARVATMSRRNAALSDRTARRQRWHLISGSDPSPRTTGDRQSEH